jgi:hypothetical protein
MATPKAPMSTASRVRVMLAEEQEQIYEEIIQFERMEYVSPQMRELIMDVWPELAPKRPPEDAEPPGELDSQFRAAAASLAVSAAACDAVSWHSGFRGGEPHAQRKTTRVHHPARRRSGNVAARGARAAASNAE